MITKTKALFGATLSGALMMAFAAPTAAVESFYKDRRVTLIVGNPAGGAYDTYSRLLARHMGRHIPGNPGFVVQNMTGAGTLVATNFLFNVAPKDGSVIGNFHERMGLEPKVQPKGTQYDGREFTWLGSMAKQTSVCITWHATGVKTVDDMRQREVIAGGSGVAGSSAVFPRVMNALLGTNLRLITGYSGTDTDIALERGEIDSRCGFGYASLKATQPEWLRDNRINIVMQFSLEPHPELPQVPMLIDMVSDPDDRLALEIMLATQEMGRPYAAPPGIPEDRKLALRHAFDQAVRDPQLLSEAERGQIEIDPISGAEIDALLQRLYQAPDAVFERVLAFRSPVSGEQKR